MPNSFFHPAIPSKNRTTSFSIKKNEEKEKRLIVREGAHVFLTKVLIYLMQQPEIKNEAQKNEEEDAFNTIAYSHNIFLVIDVSNISFLTNHYFFLYAVHI